MARTTGHAGIAALYYSVDESIMVVRVGGVEILTQPPQRGDKFRLCRSGEFTWNFQPSGALSVWRSAFSSCTHNLIRIRVRQSSGGFNFYRTLNPLFARNLKFVEKMLANQA